MSVHERLQLAAYSVSAPGVADRCSGDGPVLVEDGEQEVLHADVVVAQLASGGLSAGHDLTVAR